MEKTHVENLNASILNLGSARIEDIENADSTYVVQVVVLGYLTRFIVVVS
jgi:hypothetical protein